MGPHFWRAPATKLKKCSEFSLGNACPEPVFDDCCKIISCDLCLEFDVYGSLQTGIASFNGTEYSGSIAGAAFLLWVQRNYTTNECESVATLDGEEIDILTCYDGMSCRNLSGSAEVTIGYDTGTLTWTKIEPKPLEHITDADTGCKTWFCDECECTCECLCVTITDSYNVVTEGEICDTTYACDTPIWEGTVGDYVLSIALGRDDYGQCIITATVDGIEQAAVLAPGCGSMASTITLADGTTIAVRCKRCGCNDVVLYDCECRAEGPFTAALAADGTVCSITPVGGVFTSPGGDGVPEELKAWNDGDCVYSAVFTLFITAAPPDCIDGNTGRFIVLVKKASDTPTPLIDNSIVEKYEWYGIVYSSDKSTILDISYEYSICCKNDTPTEPATSHLIWVTVHNLDVGGPKYDVTISNPANEAAYGGCV